MAIRIFFVVLLALGAAAMAEDVVRVPSQIGNLQTAIAVVPDGGTIEMDGGTYNSPTAGFRITNSDKSFTIRSAPGVRAVLNGGGVRPVLRYENSVNDPDHQIVFESLEFTNGLSVTGGVGGGVTVAGANATFVDCSFEGNHSNAVITGGGGTFVWGGSLVLFIDCDWIDNSATNEAGGLRLDDSVAYVHRGVFNSNRVNLPNHRATATGGGFHATNATLRVSNTRFIENEAGYAGGGLYVLGTWSEPIEEPAADALLANCTFEENLAANDPSVSFQSPTEGGGLHVEDHATVKVYNSRFINNAAENGGGVNLYRSIVEIEASVFKGNQATNIGPSTGFGGAISAISNDTGGDGETNRRSANLTVRNSYLQGRHPPVGATAQIGGCLASIGDSNRRWGENGVSPAEGAEATRALALLERVVFYDCDVLETDGADGTGMGGAIQAVLTDLTLRDSMILRADAIGDGAGVDWAAGGAIRNIIDSTMSIENSTLARNSAFRFGGAIHSEGSNLDVSDSRFLNNDVDDVFGAQIFSTPYDYRDLDQTGMVENNVMVNTSDFGPMLFDGDYLAGPINDTRYNGNTLFSASQGQIVYQHSFLSTHAVSSLNSLIVNRTGSVPDTNKSQVDNIDPSIAPKLGHLSAVPSAILDVTAKGDPQQSTEAFLTYAWNGASATLDGQPIGDDTGSVPASPGIHTLDVDGDEFRALTGNGAEPAVTLLANPQAISLGGRSTLQWNTVSGTFLDLYIDHDAQPIVPAASGSVIVSPSVTTTYRMVVVTKEGGASAQVTVYVDEDPALIFSDGFESGNTFSWSASSP